jgi:hypothetical protein
MRLSTFTFLLLPFSLAFAATDNQQIPMLSTKGSSGDVYVPQKSSKPTLADLLTIETSASIFYSYARELELSGRLQDEKLKSTIFVPSNRAVMALARKP